MSLICLKWIDVAQQYCGCLLTLFVPLEVFGQSMYNSAAVQNFGKAIVGGPEVHFISRCHEAVLKLQDALTRAKTRRKLLGVTGLGQKVISACFQALDEIFLRVFGGKEDDTAPISPRP